MSLKDYIREKCKEKKMSQKKYAERCHLSEITVRKIMNGNIKRVSLDTYEALALGLDISLRELLEAIGKIRYFEKKLLDSNKSIELIDKITPILKECNIDLSELTNSQKYEIANDIIYTTELLLQKY